MAKQMGTTYLTTPPEMERLLRKYGGGAIPPLFSTQEDEGLLGNKGEEILNIYLTGFSKTYNMPLYLISISEIQNVHLQNVHLKRSLDDEIISYEDLRDMILSCENLR
ncbi:MAG: hypothetical protein ACPL7B_08145, partial [Candidatus Poribacteria bacterium]